VRRQMCRGILNAEEVWGVTRGVEVESAVRVDLIGQLGAQNIVWPLTIPGASSRDYRDEACGGFQTTRPPRSGFPDLAFRQYPGGRTLELAEVKIGTWPCLYLAQEQIEKYVTLADGNAAYKQQLGVDHVEVMPTSRLTLTQLRDPVSGTPIDVGWCSPGIIVYKAVAEQEEPEQEPKDKKPNDKGPKDNEPGPGSIPSLPELLSLGVKVQALLLADGLLGVALSFVSGLAVTLTPLLALAALAVGIVFLWDKIKSLAHMIAGAAKFVWDKVSSVVALVRDTLKAIGKTIGELAVWVGGLIKDIAEKIAEGLLAAGRGLVKGGKWLAGKIASGAEAVWDWLFGSDPEPVALIIDLPITEEPRHCVTTAHEDTIIKLDADTLFDTNKWKLKPEAYFPDYPPLKKAAATVRSMLRNSDDRVIINGYTDDVGGVDYNQRLSEQRAETVKDWLVKYGGITSIIKPQGFGKSEAKGKDPLGRAKDRRVEIWVPKHGSVQKGCW